MLTYHCSYCHHTFDAQTALCFDYRDPLKSFGCTKCQSFYRKKINIGKITIPLLLTLCIHLVLSGLVLIVIDKIPLTYFFSITLLSMVPAWLLINKNVKSQNVVQLERININ